jgi:hypothetical protein
LYSRSYPFSFSYSRSCSTLPNEGELPDIWQCPECVDEEKQLAAGGNQQLSKYEQTRLEKIERNNSMWGPPNGFTGFILLIKTRSFFAFYRRFTSRFNSHCTARQSTKLVVLLVA